MPPSIQGILKAHLPLPHQPPANVPDSVNKNTRHWGFLVEVYPKYYMEHSKKNVFIWNSNLARYPIFYLVSLPPGSQ
jgi:hypothetical protein